MLGAILGDIVGSRFEFTGNKDKTFVFLTGKPTNHYTDDSLMTLAVASALVLTKGDRTNLEEVVIQRMVDVAHKHLNVSWGSMFYKWLFEYQVHTPLNSYGNGSAMRVAPVGWVADSLEETIELSRRVTAVTHNHPEGIKGAEAIAVAIYMARTGSSKEEIKEKMVSYYPEIKAMTLQKLSRTYGIDELGNFVTCQGSVPQSIVAFLESSSLEDAIRNGVALGGDADTQACMAGAIAEAFYGSTLEQEDQMLEYLDSDLQGIYYSFDIIKKKRTNKI